MKKVIILIGIVVSTCLLGLGTYGFIMDYLSNKKPVVSNNDSLESVKTQLVEGLNKLKNAKNFTWDMTIVTEKEEEKTSSVVKINLETQESEVSMNIAGQESMHSYTVLEEQQLVSYTYALMLGDKWIRSLDNESSMTYDNSSFDVISNHIQTITKITDNLYQVIIPKDQAKSFLSAQQQENTTDEIVADVPVRIIINNGTVETIQIDFSNCIKSENVVLTKYVITNSYKDVGTTVITVPDDIKNNAVSSEELFQ